jgi:YidC/Oxa1 family membrane protein insertase
MENNRNFFITIALSVLILTLWQVFYMNPRIESQRETAQIEAERNQATQAPQPGTPPVAGAPDAAGDIPGAPAAAPAVPGGGQGAPAAATRPDALAANQRIPVDTPRIAGSINLTGGRIDDLILKDYRLTVEPNSGWLGITDKYWAATLIPRERHAPSTRTFRHDVTDRRSATASRPTT